MNVEDPVFIRSKEESASVRAPDRRVDRLGAAVKLPDLGGVELQQVERGVSVAVLHRKNNALAIGCPAGSRDAVLLVVGDEFRLRIVFIDKRLNIQERQVLTSPAVDDDYQRSAVRGYVVCKRTDAIGEPFQAGSFQIVPVDVLIEISVVGALCLTEIDAPVVRAP